MVYELSRERTGEAIKKARKIVVIGKPQVRNKKILGPDEKPIVKTEYVVAAVRGIWKAGLPAELTYRLPDDIIDEAMQELVPERARLHSEGIEVELGVGSIAAISELESALKLGFNFVVTPSKGVGGIKYRDGPKKGQYIDPIDFVKLAHEADTYAATATFTPEGIEFYLFRDDGLEPDALKIFNSELLVSKGAKALAGLLAPYARDRGKYKNVGFVIMPTGAVERKPGPVFEEAISSNGFEPALGMSDPIGPMKENASDKPGDYTVSVLDFLKDYERNRKLFVLDKKAYIQGLG